MNENQKQIEAFLTANNIKHIIKPDPDASWKGAGAVIIECQFGSTGHYWIKGIGTWVTLEDYMFRLYYSSTTEDIIDFLRKAYGIK